MEAAGSTECTFNGVPFRTSQQHSLPPHLPVLLDKFTRAYPLIKAHPVTYGSLKDVDSASHNTALSVKVMKETVKYRVNPVAAPSKAWVCGRSITGVASSNPAEGIKAISCECCVLSSTSLCARLITRPEESYRVWCV